MIVMWVKLSVLSNLNWVTYSSPNGSPDQGEEERSQMIGWSPKTEVAPSSRQRKKEIRKLVFGTELVGNRLGAAKPKAPDKGRRKLDRTRRSPIFKPVLKIT